MKISTALVSSVFAAAMLVSSGAMAAKIEVKNEGREVVAGGKTYTVSASRTQITIGGNPAGRGDLKSGMDCQITGEGEASAIACK